VDRLRVDYHRSLPTSADSLIPSRAGDAMHRALTCVLGSLVLAAVVGTLRGDEPTCEPAVDAQRIDRLIAELDSNEFDVRERATNELLGLGAAAVPKLAVAVEGSASPELQRRGSKILKKIEMDRINLHPISTDDFLAPLRTAQHRAFDRGTYEAKLQRLISVLAKGTDDDKLKLPVTMGQVQETNVPKQVDQQALYLGERYSSNTAINSIILADYDVEVMSAQNCIIVARYSVRASSCTNCVIIAGRSVTAQFIRGGAVLCGGDVTINTAQESTLSAPNVDIVGMTKLKFVNCEARQPRGGQPGQNSRFDAKDFELSKPPATGPLAGKIILTFSQPNGKNKNDGFALFQCAGKPAEYVVRVGKGLQTPDGQPLPDLAGWTLRHSVEKFAVFSDGKTESCLEVAGK